MTVDAVALPGGAAPLPDGVEPHPVGHARSAADIAPDQLLGCAKVLLDRGWRLALVAGHDDGTEVRVVYLFTAGPPDERLELRVHLDAREPVVPSLAAVSFPASRFERELRDLFGVTPVGHPKPARLVLHQHWPHDWHPMRRDAGPAPIMSDEQLPFPFLQVDGPGVYEIPVGPVHAGLIEPGHFRFSVVGETILTMRARLWYVHKGIERLFEGHDIYSAVRLAERISGDTAVGHNLAYCLAVEDACEADVPDHDQLLRALLLELERLYNHVADIGALCNDVGFGVVHAHAQRIRERLLRLNATVTGHRLLRGAITPGATRVQALPAATELIAVADDLQEVVDIALANPTVIDRFSDTAVLNIDDAADIGVVGPVGRASGLPLDARHAHPFANVPFGPPDAGPTRGDVLSRFEVRVQEVRHSVALIVAILDRVDGGPGPPVALDFERRRDSGVGIVEGWRGTITHRVEIGPGGRVYRLKVVDPSFFNWPALAIALADTIVPDFPLANKSFNLSYAGNDL
ncbi:MAG TPA: NADH-quinone oxidoreductase subunit C [Acidimicrobiales bacterium]|nr:NADH-quinone oxidoreductase subunit C [Acidimicrobiales bacterium]